MGIQDTLYSLEMGGGRIWIRRGLVLLCVLGLSLWYFVSQCRGLARPEAMESAQIAREMARGNGFSTLHLRPQSLALLREKLPTNGAFQRFPEIHQAPLYPAVLSFWFRLTQPEWKSDQDKIKEPLYGPDRVIAFFNLGCFLATVLLLYLLGSRLFDEKVGALSAGVFVVTDLAWQYAFSGLSTSWTMLLLTGMGCCFCEALRSEEEEQDGKAIGWMAGMSILMGLAILTRLSLIWILIPTLGVVAVTMRTRLVSLAILLGVVGIFIGPWLIRNSGVSGHFLGAWGISTVPVSFETRAFQATGIEQAGKRLAVRLLQGGSTLVQRQGILLGGSFAALLFWAALLHRFRRPRIRIFRAWLLLTAFFVTFGGAIVQPSPEALDVWNLLFLLFPGFILMGAGFFFVLLDRMEWEYPFLNTAGIGLFVLLNATPLVLTLAPPREAPMQYPPYFPPLIQIASSWFQKSEVLMADLPEGVAWYGDRYSMDLPLTLKEFYQIHDFLVPNLGGVLLSPVTSEMKWSEQGQSPEWREWGILLKRMGVPEGFPFTSGSSLFGEGAYFILSDRPRWPEVRAERR